MILDTVDRSKDMLKVRLLQTTAEKHTSHRFRTIISMWPSQASGEASRTE
jgi:hypothetical protein